MKKKISLLVATILAIMAFACIGHMQQAMALSIIEEQEEEKISCKATLQDDFVDDTILVALKKQATFE